MSKIYDYSVTGRLKAIKDRENARRIKKAQNMVKTISDIAEAYRLKHPGLRPD